jgi:hypothetical protein
MYRSPTQDPIIIPGKKSPDGTQIPYVVKVKNTQTIRKIRTVSVFSPSSPSVSLIFTGSHSSYLMIPPSVLKVSVAMVLYYPLGHKNRSRWSAAAWFSSMIGQHSSFWMNTAINMKAAVANEKRKASSSFLKFELIYFLRKMPSLTYTQIKLVPSKPHTIPIITAAGISQYEEASPLSTPNLRIAISERPMGVPK